MCYVQFWTKNCIDTTLGINYLNTTIANVPYTKFLGLVVDDTRTWDDHIDHLISRLNSACYAIRAVKAMLSRKALRMLCFSCAHSIISCDIIFLGNTPNSIKIFRMPKKYIYLWLIWRQWIHIENSLKQCKFYLFILNIYFSFIVCGEQQTFIYKELRVP